MAGRLVVVWVELKDEMKDEMLVAHSEFSKVVKSEMLWVDELAYSMVVLMAEWLVVNLAFVKAGVKGNVLELLLVVT
jgi:hypothetical protein